MLKLAIIVGVLLVAAIIVLGTLQAQDEFTSDGENPNLTTGAVLTQDYGDCVYFYQVDLGKWALNGEGEGDPALLQRLASCEGEVAMLLDEAQSVCPWLSDEAALEAFEAWSPAVYDGEIIRWPCTWTGP